jgi:hypothetical protein
MAESEKRLIDIERRGSTAVGAVGASVGPTALASAAGASASHFYCDARATAQGLVSSSALGKPAELRLLRPEGFR